MKTRVIVALALLPVFLAIVLFCPPWASAILVAAMSVIAVNELMEKAGLARHQLRLQIVCAVTACAVCIWCACGCDALWGKILALAFFAALVGELLAAPTSLLFPKAASAAFAALAVPYLLSALVRIRFLPNGGFYVVAALIMSFASDTGAYFFGILFGKTKLSPLISPKKTVEGFFGGIGACTVLMLTYAVVLRWLFRFDIHFGAALVYGILGSLASVAGDLFFSVIKRQSGIKDYGDLLPGHGGILDRFDSMSLAAPLAEVLAVALPMIGEKL